MAIKAPAPDPTNFLPDFRLLRVIGHGGMGRVFEAIQVSLNRKVAVKVLPSAFSNDLKARFEREARITAALNHPGIVSLYGFYETPGLCYYAMEFVEGLSLKSLISALKGAKIGQESTETGGPSEMPEALVMHADPNAPTEIIPKDAKKPQMPEADVRSPQVVSTMPSPVLDIVALYKGAPGKYFDWVADICLQVAEALQYAHEKGIIHRDLKPGNIMVTSDGKAKICDFGLAADAGSARLTFTGELLGTPAYMSPEQIAARRVPINHRTDIYSLGVTLYELLTLSAPFEHESREILLNKILFAEPERPRKTNPAIPCDLEGIALKAVSKSPDARYQTVAGLASDLVAYRNQEPVKANPYDLPERLRRWWYSKLQRHGRLRWAAVVCGILFAISYVAALLGAREGILAAIGDACFVGTRLYLRHFLGTEMTEFVALCCTLAAVVTFCAMVLCLLLDLLFVRIWPVRLVTPKQCWWAAIRHRFKLNTFQFSVMFLAFCGISLGLLPGCHIAVIRASVILCAFLAVLFFPIALCCLVIYAFSALLIVLHEEGQSLSRREASPPLWEPKLLIGIIFAALVFSLLSLVLLPNLDLPAVKSIYRYNVIEMIEQRRLASLSSEELVHYLGDNDGFVRQAAFSVLVQRRAVDELIEALVAEALVPDEEEGLSSALAASALRQITGEDFGQEHNRWRQWWEQNKGTFRVDKKPQMNADKRK